MDPVTQGVLGAALSLSSAKRKQVIWAGLCGLVGGMAPDLDTLIRSENDPLLYLEFHRQFTHSLIFIPIGGLICAGFMHLLLGRLTNINFWTTLLFCTLGYATHGFLDSATSYGTQLFWPFSDTRIAWNIISIIDPLFTGPIILLLGLSMFLKTNIAARAAMVWALAYLGIGVYQNHQAVMMGQKIAQERGHTPIGLSAKPSFGNLIVWKVIYRHEDAYYVDAVRASITPKIYQGTSIPALNIERDFPWLKKNTQQTKDIERFRWFSNGYIAQDPRNQNRIIDLRYSLLPNEITGLWSIELNQSANDDKHVNYLMHRNATQEKRDALWKMIFD